VNGCEDTLRDSFGRPRRRRSVSWQFGATLHRMTEPLVTVRPLLRTRQVREFLPDPVPDEVLHAITEVARWSGSSRNVQPWRFLVVRDRARISALHDAGLPQTRSLATAPSLIAVALPVEEGAATWHAYDEGRAVERMLVAATLLGVAAGIAWIRTDVAAQARTILGVPNGWTVRTLVTVGTPTEAARAPKAAPGTARLPREQVVFEDLWPIRA
jgi:nitroreductase